MKTSEAYEKRGEGLQCQLPEDCRIKLVGLGGVGCIVLQYLAMFLKSLERPMRLVLIDGDRFEPSNAQRMQFGAIGNKAEIKSAEVLRTLGGGGNLAVLPVPEFVDRENIKRLIRDGDHVLMCVDNHQTRRLVSRHCERLDNIVLLSGGNDGVESPQTLGVYGDVQIQIRRESREQTAPITRFHPEIANAKGKPPVGPNCGQLAASLPQILFANLAVASAMLNAYFAYACGRLNYQEVKFDILEGRALPQFPLSKPL